MKQKKTHCVQNDTVRSPFRIHCEKLLSVKPFNTSTAIDAIDIYEVWTWGGGRTIWVIHKKYRNLFLTSPLTINWITHLGLPCSSPSFSPTWQCCDDLKFNPWNPIGLKNSLIITTYSEWSKIMVTSYWFEKFECTGECLIMMKPVILIMSSHSNPCLLM